MPQMPDSFNHDSKAASNRRSGKDADHILGEKQLVLSLEIIFICFMMSIKPSTGDSLVLSKLSTIKPIYLLKMRDFKRFLWNGNTFV
jgi:hypothetical protein